MTTNKKEQIENLLKTQGRKSTTKIAITLGLHPYYASKYLNELEQEGKVKKIAETLATYWEIMPDRMVENGQ